MFAKDIKVGSKIDGWSVTDKMHGYAWELGPSRDGDIVLLTLKRTNKCGREELWTTETRTAWYSAHQEVE